MNIVFMGTPEFAVKTLEKILSEKHEVSLVVTQPDKKSGRGKKISISPIKKKAIELGIDVFQPRNINSLDSIEVIKEKNPDVIVVIAYGQILRDEILNFPKYGCINVHASLLPKYRGAAPINWSIINGETKTGITIMYMDKGLDTGDMILKKEIDILDTFDAGDLHDKLMILGADALVEALEDIDKGKINREPQNHDISSYAPMMDKTLGLIDWNKNSNEIINLVRGVTPWPGAYFNYKDRRVKVFKVESVKRIENYKNGEVIKVNQDGIFVNANDNCLIIKELQFPGKKRVTVNEFLKGNDFETGIVL